MENKVERFIDEEFANFLGNLALLFDKKEETQPDESQVVGSKVGYSHPAFEMLLAMLKPKIEKSYGKKLHPTYSFFRIYKNGHDLKKHSDRPSCQVSVTLNLLYNTDFLWPIYIDGIPLGMKAGEGVIYKGCEQVHWRDPLVYTGFEGQEEQEHKLLHVQVFLHYIEAGGQFDPEFKYDGREGLSYE